MQPTAFNLIRGLLTAALVLSAGSAAGVDQDYSTPRAARQTLLDAYRAKDIKSAVESRDFRFEAEDMLVSVMRKHGLNKRPSDELIAEAAEGLRKLYELELVEEGFPDLTDYDCRITSEAVVEKDYVEMVEECVNQSDSSVARRRVHAFNGENGWRIVFLAEDQ